MNVRDEAVVFHFDAVVSDRPVGVRDLESAFVISPTDGQPRVRWRRNRIEVRPRRGFLDSTAYAVTMLPGIADLRGNVRRAPTTVVFSTGPTIPQFAVHGRVFDWMNQRPAPNALVEVIRRPDSLPYIGTADSTGQFAVGPLEEGRYTVRAFVDANNNRTLDAIESWDSLSVLVQGTNPFLELLAAPRDTIAPRLLTVTAPDSLTLVATFDRPLDPNVPLTPASFRVAGADSTPLSIATVRTRAQVAAQRAAQDSARADSIARADTTAQPAPAAVRPAPRPPTVPQPTMAMVARPSRPAPTREVTIGLDSLTPMRSGQSYLVTARNARGLLRATGTSERTILIPVARDSAAAPSPTPPPPAAPVTPP